MDRQSRSVAKSAYHARQSVARLNRHISILPQYNPDSEAAEVRNLQAKKLRFLTLFRYATWKDICLMILGILAAIACGISLPYLIYWHGRIVHFGLEDERCMVLLRNSSGHTNFTRKTPLEIGNWFQYTMTLFVFNLLTCFGFVACFAFAAENQISLLRIAYFESLVRKDMSWLDNYVEREFGRHMTHDITQIRSGIGEKFCYIIYVIIAIISLIGMAFICQWKLALIMIVLGPLASGIGYVSSFAEAHEATYIETANANSGIAAEETLSNIKTVKAYEGEAKEIQKFENALRSAFGWKWILLGAAAGAACFMFLLSHAVLLYFGSGFVWSDLENKTQCEFNLTYGWEGPEDLFVVFFCILFASLHILELPTLLSQISGAVDVASDVFFMIDWKPRIDNMSENGDLPESAAIGKIEFDDVSFRYPRKLLQSALHHINMIIYPGQVIALVGTLGCGKSTILRLIQRLYDPTGGNIYLDGHNIENLNITWLRSQIAIVSQEPVLFNKSVEENIRYARWKATAAEIQDACKMAGIHEFILQLKDGYQTSVGHSGSLLGASQKRQLSFARAYLQRPRILILDDPVAGCVPEFEELVLRAITQLRDRTTIILASTVINSLVQISDRIYVMDKGTILERGNHDYLVAKNGAYVELKNRIGSGTEQNSKFISQLTSYRFAQSLRRMHLRKSRAMHEDRKKMNALHQDPDNVHDLQSRIHALHHNRRIRTNQAIVLRVAGGLQRYNYTRTMADHNLHFRRNLEKGLKKVQHERGLKARSKFGKEEESTTVLLVGEMQRHRQSFSLQLPMQNLPMRPRAESISSNSSSTVRFADERRVSESASAALSIGSEDSIAFWADYEEMLDKLEDVHTKTSWKDVLKLGLLQKNLVIASILTSFLLGCCPPISFVLLTEIFDGFTIAEQGEAEKDTFFYCIALVILATVSGLFAFLQETAFSLGGYKMMINLRRKIFSHILKQDQEWFDKPENDISFLCSRLSVDACLVKNILIISVGVIVQSFTSFFLATCIAFTFTSARLVALYAFGLACIILVVVFADGWFQKELEWITDIKALQDATEIEIDVITNIRTVITLGLERHFLEDFKTEVNKSQAKLFGVNLVRSVLFGLSYALPYGFFSVLVYIYYSQDISEPRFVDIFRITELLIFGVLPIGTALVLIPNISMCLGAAYRINRILTSKPRIEQTMDEKQTPKISVTFGPPNFESPPKIELENVQFNFNLNIEYSIIRDVSFVVGKRQKVAIVGPEGCGKSSIIQLLLRLYEPTAGCIYINNDPFYSVSLKSTKKITAFIEQNPTIFDCSIRDNIAYGDNSREVTMHEITEAATLANAHSDIIRLSQGYETQISSLDSFQESSFGLRQRIVFARAMIRNPKLFLIDEATASVDPESDFVLLQALDACCADRTTIIASQRIEPIRNADLIIVLNNGYVIEQGTDRELIEKNGYYFNMYMAQREAEGFSTNVEDIVYQRGLIGDDPFDDQGDIEPDTDRRQGRRKSSLQYLKYLKNRLRDYMPKVSSVASIADMFSSTTSGSSIESSVLAEYADYITTIEALNKAKHGGISQGQAFLESIRANRSTSAPPAPTSWPSAPQGTSGPSRTAPQTVTTKPKITVKQVATTIRQKNKKPK